MLWTHAVKDVFLQILCLQQHPVHVTLCAFSPHPKISTSQHESLWILELRIEEVSRAFLIDSALSYLQSFIEFDDLPPFARIIQTHGVKDDFLHIILECIWCYEHSCRIRTPIALHEYIWILEQLNLHYVSDNFLAEIIRSLCIMDRLCKINQSFEHMLLEIGASPFSDTPLLRNTLTIMTPIMEPQEELLSKDTRPKSTSPLLSPHDLPPTIHSKLFKGWCIV